MLLGFARGKVGSLVFSRVNGAQVTRAKADVVRNPKTLAQYIQRIILNTISQAYSNMSAICDHSFQGVQKGQKSMSFFMRQNMDKLRRKVAEAQAAGLTTSDIYAFTPLGSNLFLINDYVISSGELPTIEVGFPAAPDMQNYSIISGLSANTYQAVCDALGLQRGDQLTFIQVQGWTPDSLKFNYCRVILDPRNNDGSDAPMDSIFILNGEVAFANWRNEGGFNQMEYSDGEIHFKITNRDVFGSAVIASRQDNEGNWLRSSSVLVSHVANAESGWGNSLEEAIEESMYGLSVESDRYLNNAGRGAQSLAAAGTPRIATITIAGVEFAAPKAYQLENGATSVVVNAITANFLRENKTYKLKLFNAAGTQQGADIVLNSSGEIASTTLSMSGQQTYTLSFFEGDTKIQDVATFDVDDEDTPPPSGGGGFGG